MTASAWSERLGRSGFPWVLGCCLLLASCGRSRPDFGTLPRVEIPIEKKPEQDPTLFQDEEDEEDVPRVSSDPPDPPPLRMTSQIDYELEFNKGEVSIVSQRSLDLAAPQSTPRRLGRFAFELWSGAQLIERVRFDFPLLGASQPGEEDRLEAGLMSRTTVRIPASARATRARILDRKTRKAVMVPWPPAAKTGKE